jgi:hypothetical protein
MVVDPIYRWFVRYCPLSNEHLIEIGIGPGGLMFRELEFSIPGSRSAVATNVKIENSDKYVSIITVTLKTGGEPTFEQLDISNLPQTDEKYRLLECNTM